MQSTLQKIAVKNNLNLKKVTPLQGGDINQVFLLNCEKHNFVIKLNDTYRFPTMFEAEARGLELLKSSQSFKIPEVICFGKEKNTSYLLLQYIPNGTPTKFSWRNFSQNLAKLHRTTNDFFGLNHTNYIGSLPQFNIEENSAATFFINQRLVPQFNLATEKGFHFPTLNNFLKNISEEIPEESASLIHGDLWNGNYIISEKGIPVLIDPAVSFAPREMDLAMMQLFGGFPEKVFSVYHEIFPLKNNWEERVSIWQLYYLLVHLNLFGSSYLPQVNYIMNKYS